MKILLLVYGTAAIITGACIYQSQMFVTPGLYVLGSVVLGFGLWIFCKQGNILKKTVKTFGKLSGWGEESSISNPRFSKPYYYAQVVFEDHDGVERHVTSATGTRPKPRMPIGHPMPVRYNPENPDEARVDTFFDFWGPSLIIMLFGCLTIGAAFLHKGHSHG